MYSFFTESGRGFVTMHYERFSVGKNLEIPQHLGHTVVRTETKPVYAPPGLLLPAKPALPPSPEEMMRQATLRRAELLATADRYETLDEFVAQGAAFWRKLLENETVELIDTQFAPVTRPKDVDEPKRSESGLLIITSQEQFEVATGGAVDEEFVEWVASPQEMDSIERLVAPAQAAAHRAHFDLAAGTGQFL